MSRTNHSTQWGRMTHVCVGNLTTIGSDNGLSPGRRQAITWANVGILLIGPIGTNFNKMLFEIHTFSFKKIHLKLSSGKWQPFCLGLNMLRLVSKPSSEKIYSFALCTKAFVLLLRSPYSDDMMQIWWVVSREIRISRQWAATIGLLALQYGSYCIAYYVNANTMRRRLHLTTWITIVCIILESHKDGVEWYAYEMLNITTVWFRKNWEFELEFRI